jgi:4'-phosphopantetheinyl transferase
MPQVLAKRVVSVSAGMQSNRSQVPAAYTVHLWTVDLTAAFGPPLVAANGLSKAEIEQAANFRSEAARHRFVTTRAALRIVLGKLLRCAAQDIVIDIGINGKPQLGTAVRTVNSAVGKLHFNVAHSGERALIAVADCDVGVDIEQLRPVSSLEQIAKRYFHPHEIDSILSTPPSERANAFLRCWTCKEAVLKAFGRGIGSPLNEFAVKFQEIAPSEVRVGVSDELTCWMQPLDLGAGYVGAVATVGKPAGVLWRNFDAQDAAAERPA